MKSAGMHALLSPLPWQMRLGVVVVMAMALATAVAPACYYLLGGGLDGRVAITGLISALVVTPPLAYNVVVLGRTAQRLRERAEHQKDILRSLLESSAALHRSDELVSLLEGMLTQLHNLLPEHYFCVVVDGNRPHMVRYFSSHGISETESHLLAEHNSTLLKPEQSLVLARLRALDPQRLTAWSIFALPGRGDAAIGKLVVKGPPLRHQDRDVLNLFLEHLAVATENRLLSLELEKLAHIDDLTSLYNRNYFNREITRQIELKHANNAIDFAVLVVDLNGLKTINDNLGHMAGDSLISETGSLLNQLCRAEDFVCRVGGDEFVILCPGTRLEQACRLEERIRKAAGETRVDFAHLLTEESPPFTAATLSLSLGVSASDETTPERAIQLADQRMYQDKRHHYQLTGNERRGH